MGIPLVRATALHPMIVAMEEINVSSAKLLDEARIPRLDCCNPGDWISTERMVYLETLMRRESGIPSAAYYVANAASIADMGEFGKLVLQSSTLKEALDRFCDNLIYYRSSASCYLMRGRNSLWVCRQTRGSFHEGYEQLELFALAEMIKVARLAAGPEWWPDNLHFQSRRSPTFQDAAEDAGVELRFNQEFGGFAIPLPLLALPLRYKDGGAASEFFPNDTTEYWKPAADDFIGSLRQILPCYMRDGEIKVELVAEVLGFSVRTLQRQLAQHGI